LDFGAIIIGPINGYRLLVRSRFKKTSTGKYQIMKVKNATSRMAQHKPVSQDRLQKSCWQNARDHLFMRAWLGHGWQQGIIP
jgi:hypothetical protein